MPHPPLQVVVVLDLTTALSGPYATMLLAGLGARVIKIENPRTGGDSSRGNAPYVTRDGLSLSRTAPDDMSLSWVLRGRNKESVTLDLKTTQGAAVLRELARRADVLVENYSAGVTQRVGISYDHLREFNPSLVYTSISGYGQQGRPGGDRAMDTIVQALSGLMLTAGLPDDPPVRYGVPIGDLVAPLFAVIGTLAALAQRRDTGEGQHVDVSMLGSLTSLVACEPFDALEELGVPQRTGSSVPRLAPFGTFECSDGWIALCAPTDAMASAALRSVGRADLLDDARFSSRDARVANSDLLHQLINDWTLARSVDDAISQLGAGGVPVAPVRDTGDAVHDPLLLARGEVLRVRHRLYGEIPDVRGSGIPIVFSGSEATLDEPAPELGQDTERVLTGLLGLDDEQLKALRAAGALGES